MQNNNNILKELKKEINKTLYFFVESDLNIYGFITESTINCFTTQGVKFPKKLKSFLKPNK